VTYSLQRKQIAPTIIIAAPGKSADAQLWFLKTWSAGTEAPELAGLINQATDSTSFQLSFRAAGHLRCSMRQWKVGTLE
jgi:hypothetical protein